MSEPQGSLIYLMRFLDGHLSVPENSAARRRLDEPDWQTAWQRLQLAAVETPLPVTTWEEPTVPAETLAAFLEGTLSLNEAARIEQLCWNSPEMLREVVSTYRFLHGEASPSETLAGQDTRNPLDVRLLALMPATDEPLAPPSERFSAPEIEPASVTPTSNGRAKVSPEAPGPDAPVVVNAGKRSRRLKRRRTPVWVVYVATIVIGLGLGLGAFVMISLSRDTGTNSHQEIVTPSDGKQPSDSVEKQGGGPSDELPQRPEPSPDSPRPFPNRPIDVVQDGSSRPKSDPPPRPSPGPSPDPSPGPSPTVAVHPPTEQYRSLAVDWDKIEGLLVVRENDKQPWQGPLADVNRNAASIYATLPGSWASAKTNHGRLVLAEDTQVQLDGTRDSIHMNVERGRVAISEIPADQNVRLQVGARSWIIQPMEEDTAFGCTVFARQSQLVVRRGSVSIGGTEIIAGRQVALSDGELEKPTPLAASTGWFTRPETSVDIPPALRDELMASRDVRADLLAIWRSEDHPARLLATRWSLAIGNNVTLAHALSARDDHLRLAALEWLLACDPEDPRVLLALRTLARQTGDNQMVRNVLNWLKSARTKSRVTRADADKMVSGLRSDHLAIRQISAFFLETAFTKRVAFDPTAGPVARQTAAREWTALLNRIYAADRATKK